MWQKFNEQCLKQANKADEVSYERKLPDWLEKYIRYKFDLFDRTGDGYLDCDEFEYVLGYFGVPVKDARSAFLMISQVSSYANQTTFYSACIVKLERTHVFK